MTDRQPDSNSTRLPLPSARPPARLDRFRLSAPSPSRSSHRAPLCRHRVRQTPPRPSPRRRPRPRPVIIRDPSRCCSPDASHASDIRSLPPSEDCPAPSLSPLSFLTSSVLRESRPRFQAYVLARHGIFPADCRRARRRFFCRCRLSRPDSLGQVNSGQVRSGQVKNVSPSPRDEIERERERRATLQLSFPVPLKADEHLPSSRPRPSGTKENGLLRYCDMQ